MIETRSAISRTHQLAIQLHASTAMEDYATDSFSYSWSINPKPSFDALVESLRPSLDIYCESSNKEAMHIFHHQDFDFSFHLDHSGSSDSLVHADEIFSNGCIMPLCRNGSQKRSLNSVPAVSRPCNISSFSCMNECFAASRRQPRQQCFLKKLDKSSNSVFRKCFGFLLRFGLLIEGFKVQASPDGRNVAACIGDERWAEIKRSSKNANDYLRLRNTGSRISPQGRPFRSTDSWSDIESPIDEAILHCKRSFSM